MIDRLFIIFIISTVIFIDKSKRCIGNKVVDKYKCFDSLLEKNAKGPKKNLDPSYIAGLGIGRLGNQMSAFATLFALHKLHGFRIFSAPFQKNLLNFYFSSEFLNSLENQPDDFKNLQWIRPFSNYDYSDQKIWNIHKYEEYIDIGLYPNSINLFKQYKEELREIFNPIQEHKELAEKRLQEIKSTHLRHFDINQNATLTFIGIHVRRSDYKKHLNYWYKKMFVDEKYFSRAIRFYRKQFKNPIFFVISDDPLWCKMNITPLGEDIYYAGHSDDNPDDIYPKSAGIDMIILSQANHTILTYGTFGQWGAFFSGGQAVWPKTHLDTKEAKEVLNAKIKGWKFI